MFHYVFLLSSLSMVLNDKSELSISAHSFFLRFIAMSYNVYAKNLNILNLSQFMAFWVAWELTGLQDIFDLRQNKFLGHRELLVVFRHFFQVASI